MEKKYIIIFSLLLFLPWLNIVYSYYSEDTEIGNIIPPNKCVALAKLELEKKSKFEKLDIIKKYKEEQEKPLEKEKETIQKEGEKNKEGDVLTTPEIQNTEGIEQETVEEELPPIPKERKPLGKVLIVGDSLGEGLLLAYKWKLSKDLKDCLNLTFLVKHSTTTKTWRKNKKLFEELESGNYDTLVIVLGANEWGIDKTTLYYNINKLYLKIRETNPDIDIYWVVPSTKNKQLREYVEEVVGKDKTIAIEDFQNEIPLSRDKVHPDMRKKGYAKLWYVILQTILAEKVLNCQK